MTILNQQGGGVMAAKDNNNDPFADYMWMGEMDKFDREMEAQIEEEFEEEEFIKSCIEQLLDEEEERETVYFGGGSNDSTKKDHHSRIPDPKNTTTYDGQNFLNMNGLDPNLAQNMNNMYISNSQHIHSPPHQLPHSFYQNGDSAIPPYENGPHPQHAAPNLWYSNKEPLPYHTHPQQAANSHHSHTRSDPRANKRGGGGSMKKESSGHPQQSMGCPSQPKSWTNIKATDCKMVPPGYLGPYPLAKRKQYSPHDDAIAQEPRVSTLNPKAVPFVMNPNAKVFMPQSSSNLVANQVQNQPQ